MKKLLVILCVLGLAGCYYDSEEELYPAPSTGVGCDTTNVGYAAVIQPILNQYCAVSGCHTNAIKAGNYDFSSHGGTLAAVNSNRLLGAIMHQAGFSQMPQGMAKLDDCSIAKVKAWVNGGAKNN